MTRGAGVGTSGTGAARAWGGINFAGASEAAAIAANQFATFTATATTGFSVSFSSVSTFDYRRSATGPGTGRLQYQLGSGGFVDGPALTYTSTASTGAALGPIDLSSIAALQNVPAGTLVTFRIVNWGGGAAGTWYIFDRAISDDFGFRGAGNGRSSGHDAERGDGRQRQRDQWFPRRRSSTGIA